MKLPWSCTLRRTTFRSLQSKNYRFYFFGQIVSFTGSWMQSAALMWLVFYLTNDPLWPPLMLVAQVGPTLIFGTLGGALADKVAKRKLIFVSQAAFLLNCLLLLALVALGGVTPWLLLMLNLVSGLIQSVDLPARLAFVPDLVPTADLINAVSLNSLVFNSARAVGPALAGLCFLVAGVVGVESPVMFGAVICFGLNALSYAAVLLALRRITVGVQPPSSQQGGSVWDGFRYFRRNRRLAALLLLTGVLCVFSWPMLTLFPAYTQRVLGHAEKEYSFLVSALGTGALLASLTNATIGSVRLRGWLFSVGASCIFLGVLGLACTSQLWFAMFFAALAGYGMILFLSTGQSTLQMSVTQETRGRVMALWAMMLSASAPLGHLVAGLAAQHYAMEKVLFTLACGTGVCASIVIGLSLSFTWQATEKTVLRD